MTIKLVRSAKIVVLDADNKALLLRRSHTHPTDAFEPDIPGGTIEHHETIEEGILRELEEEVGLIITEDDLTLLYTLTFDNIPGVSINRLLYAARLSSQQPTITLSWEHDEFKWVEISELKGLERPYQKGVDYATTHGLWDSV